MTWITCRFTISLTLHPLHRASLQLCQGHRWTLSSQVVREHKGMRSAASLLSGRSSYEASASVADVLSTVGESNFFVESVTHEAATQHQFYEISINLHHATYGYALVCTGSSMMFGGISACVCVCLTLIGSCTHTRIRKFILFLQHEACAANDCDVHYAWL